jgi:putative addiction module component (TIGR02574 family)
MTTRRDLLGEALALPRQERARLVHQLLLSLDDDEPEPADTVEAAWAGEIRRRMDELERGEVEGIDADAVHEELRAELDARRRS